MDFESKSPHSRKSKFASLSAGPGHERYAELCALFTSDSLTAAEQEELNAHLLNCQPCAQLLLEYRAVAKSGAALLAPLDQDTPASVQKPWSIENAKKQLSIALRLRRR